MSLDRCALPCLHVRISGGQLAISIADVKPLVCAMLTLEFRCMPISDAPEYYRELRRDQPEIQPDSWQPHLALKAFWLRLNAIARRGDGRHRISVDLFEAKTCAIGLRLARRKYKSDPPSSIANNREMDKRRSRLLRQFENLARRLQRRFDHTANEAARSDFCQTFAWYHDAILDVLFSRHAELRNRAPIRQTYVRMLDQACTVACRGLEELGFADTKPKEVRPLVRRFLAYARRGRIRFSTWDLSDPSSFTSLRLANFVAKGWAKENRKSKRGSSENRRCNEETPEIRCLAT